MNISPSTTVGELLGEYRFLQRFLVDYHPRFALISEGLTGGALGRAITLERLAAVGDIDPDDLLSDLARQVNGICGDCVRVSLSTDGHRRRHEDRTATLAEVVGALVREEPADGLHAHLLDLARQVDQAQIAEARDKLISEGLDRVKVEQFCNDHLNNLNQILNRPEATKVLPGHPVNTLINENHEITKLAELLAFIERERRDDESPLPADFLSEVACVLGRLGGARLHYRRNETHLFPPLERRGMSGPLRALWDVHDEALALLDALTFFAAERDERAVLELLRPASERLLRVARLENEVLYPLALGMFNARDWSTVRRGEERISFAFPASDRG